MLSGNTKHIFLLYFKSHDRHTFLKRLKIYLIIHFKKFTFVRSKKD